MNNTDCIYIKNHNPAKNSLKKQAFECMQKVCILFVDFFDGKGVFPFGGYDLCPFPTLTLTQSILGHFRIYVLLPLFAVPLFLYKVSQWDTTKKSVSFLLSQEF